MSRIALTLAFLFLLWVLFAPAAPEIPRAVHDEHRLGAFLYSSPPSTPVRPHPTRIGLRPIHPPHQGEG